MSSLPYISVIVPVHNSERYLKCALESIFNQDTSLDYEILLVDDGSTDGSGSICDQIVALDSRARVFHIDNSGVSAARNVGIDNSRGEWLLFMDSDDELMSSAFSLLKNGILDDTVMCMAGYEVYNQNGELDFHVEQRLSDNISIKDCLLQMYHPMYFYYQGYLWNKLFKSDVIKRGNLRFDEDIKFNEDRLFVVRYLCGCTGTVYYTTAPVYKYFRRSTGVMASLERGFNAGFLTDFVAFVRMKELVEESFPDKRMVRMAKDGVRGSYDRIVSMIHRFDADGQAIIPQLKKSMRQALGLYYYMPYYIKIKHKVKQTFIKKHQI